MVEQDHRTPEQIRAKIEAVYAPGEFWGTVIKCAGTLRKQWNAGKLDNVGKEKLYPVYIDPEKEMDPEPEKTGWEKLCASTADPGFKMLLMVEKIVKPARPERWSLVNTEHGLKFWKTVFEHIREHEHDTDLPDQLISLLGEFNGY